MVILDREKLNGSSAYIVIAFFGFEPLIGAVSRSTRSTRSRQIYELSEGIYTQECEY